jgi:hypothetical protein
MVEPSGRAGKLAPAQSVETNVKPTGVVSSTTTAVASRSPMLLTSIEYEDYIKSETSE